MMGELVEREISEACNDGVRGLEMFLTSGNDLKLFTWMGLLFIKTHLKDRPLRSHLDARKGTGKIADIYDWATLHHIHSLVRC
jgi:hypothetical protein